MIWSKEQFENNKRLIEEDTINQVKKQYKELLEYADENKKDYERYVDEENWNSALIFFYQYNKDYTLAKCLKAYLDTIENNENKESEKNKWQSM